MPGEAEGGASSGVVGTGGPGHEAASLGGVLKRLRDTLHDKEREARQSMAEGDYSRALYEWTFVAGMRSALDMVADVANGVLAAEGKAKVRPSRCGATGEVPDGC